MSREPLWRRYLHFFGPDSAADLDDELEFHLDAMAREYADRGVPPAEARARAEREFGDARRARRECDAISRRVARRRGLADRVDALRRDLRHAVRTLVRAPGFAVLAILTLALGLAVTTAIFSVVDAVLLRPLPYPEADRLVRLWERSPTGDDRNPVSMGNFIEWRDRARSLDAVVPHRGPWSMTLTGEGDASRIRVAEIGRDVQGLLGVRPLAGRLFSEADTDGGGRVVLVSEALWRDRLGGGATVAGRSITIDDRRYEVVGVLPAGFAFPSPRVDVWMTVTRDLLDPNSRRSHNWLVVGRLAPGATLERAQAEMDVLAAGLGAEYPEFMKDWGVSVVRLHDDLVGSVRPLLRVLLGGALLVLLIACANVSNLFLAHGVGRQRELAVRGALGAGRGRLIRQLLLDAGLVALVAGIVGVGLAEALVRGLVAVAPAQLPRLDQVRIDTGVLAFAGLATAVSALLFGAVPAVRLGRADLHTALRSGGDRAGSRHARFRGALLVGEVALSLVLLVGAGLLLRSGLRLGQVDYGYRPDGLLAVSVTLPYARYPDVPAQIAGFDRILEEVRAVSGVAAATSTSAPPADGALTTFSFAIEGRESPNPTGRFEAFPLAAVTADYFGTLGIPLLRGRVFDERDRIGAPGVAVINQALARKLWPDEDPVGARIQFREGQPWMEVIGVVGDTRMQSADAPPDAFLYVPFRQKVWTWLAWQTLIVRAEAGQTPAALSRAVESAVHRADPALAPGAVAPVVDLYADGLASRRFATSLVGAFATAALLLGVIGLYGVLASVVAERRREIAIRSALGASRSTVTSLVVRQALLLTLGGVAIGVAAAIGMTRLLASLLYEISPLDPATFAVVAMMLVVVAVAAALVPARRAALVDPLVAMRDS